MSWSDALKGAIGNIAGEAEQAALPGLMQNFLGAEGLQALIAKLEAAGLGGIVQSWFDKNKDSLPVTADQLRKALGDEHVQQIAKTLGIPVDAILNALAEWLPKAAEAAGSAADPKPAETARPDPTKPAS